MEQNTITNVIEDYKKINKILVFDLFEAIDAQLPLQVEYMELYNKYKEPRSYFQNIDGGFDSNDKNRCDIHLLKTELNVFLNFCIKNKTKIDKFRAIDFCNCNPKHLHSFNFNLDTEEEREIWHELNTSHKQEYLFRTKILELKLQENYYYKLQDVCKEFLNIIDFIETKAVAKSSIENAKSELFDMELIGALYKLCNQNQFENITQPDFYNALTSINSKKKLKCVKRQNLKVYYLISRLKTKILDKSIAQEWDTSMIKALGLDPNTYNKKKNQANQEFKEEIDKLIP